MSGDTLVIIVLIDPCVLSDRSPPILDCLNVNQVRFILIVSFFLSITEMETLVPGVAAVHCRSSEASSPPGSRPVPVMSETRL